MFNVMSNGNLYLDQLNKNLQKKCNKRKENANRRKAVFIMGHFNHFFPV